MTTPSQPFSVNGVTAYRMVGVLVVVIGLLVGGIGLSFAGIGHAGTSRYSKTTGRLVRIFSPQDEKYYGYLKGSVALGWVLVIVGAGVTGVGAMVARRPRMLYELLNRAGIHQQ